MIAEWMNYFIILNVEMKDREDLFILKLIVQARWDKGYGISWTSHLTVRHCWWHVDVVGNMWTLFQTWWCSFWHSTKMTILSLLIPYRLSNFLLPHQYIELLFFIHNTHPSTSFLTEFATWLPFSKKISIWSIFYDYP